MKEKLKALKSQVITVYLLMREPRTPILAKVLAGIAVAYALSPMDLIPDFIPILGYLDDLLIIPGLVFLVIKLVPKELWESCLRKSQDISLQKSWKYAIPIVLIWLVLITGIIYQIFRKK